MAPPDTLTKLLATAGGSRTGMVGSVLYRMDRPSEVQAWGGGTILRWVGFARHFVTAEPLGSNSFLTFASVLLRRELVLTAGLLDEGFFLYFEDADLCFRARNAGWQLAVAADTAVLHREGGSSHPEQTRVVTASGLRFLKRHGRPAWMAMMLFVLSRLGKRLVRGEWNEMRAVLAGVSDWWRSGCEQPEQQSEGKRALIVKLGAIGDVVMVIPAAHALHRAGYEVHWVCGSTVAPLLACYPWIKTIVVDERAIMTGDIRARSAAVLRVWRGLAFWRYDLCATLYYDRRYRLLTLPVWAYRRVALSSNVPDCSLVPGRHHSAEYLRILTGTVGDENRLVVPVPPELLPPSPLARLAGVQRVVLVPAGAKNLLRADILRRWPAEHYAALAAMLLGKGVEIVLLGGPDDHWAETAFAGLPVVSLIGELSLPQSVALLNDSDVMVTHDTGPLHLGGITNVGIVAIFGPTDPHTFHPPRAGTIAIWGGERLPCRPCYDGRGYPPCLHNACVREITVEMVANEVIAMLAARGRGHIAPMRLTTPSRIMAAGAI